MNKFKGRTDSSSGYTVMGNLNGGTMRGRALTKSHALKFIDNVLQPAFLSMFFRSPSYATGSGIDFHPDRRA
jgi:hypothetical protein